jgi:uncharacterized protein (TIGR03000 family)
MRQGISAVVGFLHVSAAFAWDFGGPAYQQGFPKAPPASYFGYNLDDPQPGYFGGGRYREYYSYGRGYGLANFPGPLPNYPYGYVPKSFRGYPSAWSPPRDAVPMPMIVGTAEPVAYLDIKVPPDAEIWIDDARTQQTGSDRTFVTPPLPVDRASTYEIKAKWTEAGRSVEQAQIVLVQPGRRIPVTFPADTAIGGGDEPGRFPLATQR